MAMYIDEPKMIAYAKFKGTEALTLQILAKIFPFHNIDKST